MVLKPSLVQRYGSSKANNIVITKDLAGTFKKKRINAVAIEVWT